MYISGPLHIGIKWSCNKNINIKRFAKFRLVLKTKGAGGISIPEAAQKQDTGIADKSSIRNIRMNHRYK